MLGAIIGDIVGSRFEFNNHLSKEFAFFHPDCEFTDDTVMTCAVAYLFLDNRPEDVTPRMVVRTLQKFGRAYPNAGYGSRFYDWVFSSDPAPYNSCGNGSAMRVSPVGWVAQSEQQVKDLSRLVTEVTHNHPEGIKGAECTALCVYLARKFAPKAEILNRAKEYYTLDKTCDEIREETRGHHGQEICQVTMPQALQCFAEGDSYEDVIRNCVSIGGDTDTIAAIAGAIAEAYYGIPDDIKRTSLLYLNSAQQLIISAFSERYKDTKF